MTDQIEKAATQTAKGRDGWRFIFRDYGKRLTMKDYMPVITKRVSRSTKDYNVQRLKTLDKALAELKEGKFIQGDMLVMLCKEHGVKISKNVLFQLKYMNELDVSINTLRHRNARGDFKRNSFNGIFSVIEYLIAKTI